MSFSLFFFTFHFITDGIIETTIRIADIKKIKCNEFINLLIAIVVMFDAAKDPEKIF
jgi:hypothetical protein